MVPIRFTVRVYGILVNRNREILLSKEKIGDFGFTKFPGGGLEFGEGPKDCLIREFKEETGLDIIISDHIYTSDFYIQSQIDPEEQVIGIYYKVEVPDVSQLDNISLESKEHHFGDQIITIQHIWTSINAFEMNILTFEMDRRAMEFVIS